MLYMMGKFRFTCPEKEKLYYQLREEQRKKDKRERSLKYYYKNREDIREKKKKRHKETYQSKRVIWGTFDRKEYDRKRSQQPLQKLHHSIYNRIREGLIKYNKIKNKKTIEILGLENYKQFKQHIESLWEPGMTWENYGVGKNNSTWHIDHIIPISCAINENDIYRLNHYSNLRPMWCSNNIQKGGCKRFKIDS